MTEPESPAQEELLEEDEEGSRRRRILISLSLLAVALLAIYLIFYSGSEYTVTAEFENAGQLVKGNDIVLAGAKVGTVKNIELGDHGQALVTFSVNDDFAPLHRGTTATIRDPGLSVIAGREVELRIPPPSEAGPEIPDGGDLTQSETVSAVDLDQVFNTLNPKAVKNLKHVIQGFEIAYSGVGKQANRGFKYLNPFLSTTRRVVGELNLDQPALESLLVDTSQLSGTLAARAPDLSLLVHNANLMMSAIGSQRQALAESVAKLPPFMRQANTTFVNLRATLDDLDPLVNATKPVADRLGPFFRTFRGAARDAVPTIRDLDAIGKRKGPQNDLIELTKDAVPLAKAGVGTGSPDCGSNPTTDFASAADEDFTQGALGESTCALRNGLPALSFFRGYTPELTGWFNDFGTSGVVDANGGFGRIATTFNPFTLSIGGVPQILKAPLTPLQQLGALDFPNPNRCPGGNERPAPDGSNPFTDNGALNCNPALIPPGP